MSWKNCRKRKVVLGGLCASMMSLFILFQLSYTDGNVQEVREPEYFNWLRNVKLLSEIMKPDEDTQLYLPSSLSESKGKSLISCFVLSAPKNIAERSAIRETWGSLIKPLFMLGISDSETSRLVLAEAKLFNDIIVEDFVDSYQNLTLKTGFCLKHFLRYTPNATYFMKIDDDVYLNVPNLLKVLNDESTPKTAIIGHVVSEEKPHRTVDHKNYIPVWLYGDKVFPSFVDGPTYLIPGSIQNEIKSLQIV